ncbi:hypothetical protein HMN09_00512700 [Mycena chlorophos]|uniref:DUF962-domain-containing protein n=1 Tax=Mycena chlorophos TaxID=658473 RepID=A0A8H6T9X0_MYCCL|nr:hypothetical protein HMN09_00512700 [Mycena chlorophos]
MASLFDVEKQLTFYGAYHANRINVLIHIICVPLILCSSSPSLAQRGLTGMHRVRVSTFDWPEYLNLSPRTSFAMVSRVPMPEATPKIHYAINDFLVFDLNLAAIGAAVYGAYYYILEPFAALLYTPQLTLMTLTSIAYGNSSLSMNSVVALFVVCWIAQFLGHGLAEKRSPALLDNLVGGPFIRVIHIAFSDPAILALVLAPFFVHLELLFGIGYRPEMHKRLTNEIGKEITRVKKAEGDARRAKAE